MLSVNGGGLFGALDLLKLVDGGGFAVLIAADALGEEFLDVGIAHVVDDFRLVAKF